MSSSSAPNVSESRLVLLHADESLAVFDKPSGLLVHRGWGDDAITATDLAREALGAAVSPVHRLDRGTSGVLLFARSAEIAARMQAAFEAGQVEKTYLAFVRGSPPDEGVVDHPIPRREGGPRVPALTRFRTRFRVNGARLDDLAGEVRLGDHPGEVRLGDHPGEVRLGDLPAEVRLGDLPAELRRASLVEARPATGRLHQVRRHMKHLSHPIIGDANYGKGALNRAFADAIGLRRLALHAASLRFVHPATGASMLFVASVPPDLADPLARLGVPAEAWRTES